MISSGRYLVPSLLALLLLAVGDGALVAQEGRFVRSIVSEDLGVRNGAGLEMPNPFSGGFDLTRIGLWENDRDGLPDLWTYNFGGEFRRYGNRDGETFVRVLDTTINALPIRSWFRFADITGDGAPELFTSGARSEVMQMTNLGGTSSTPDFGAPDTVRRADGSPIYTEQLTVPTLVDIDNDGDRDLFSGNVDGTVTFYENTGSATEPEFTFRTNRYEGLLVLSPAEAREKEDPHAASSLHGASVIDFADLDGDDDLDMLFGDFFTKRLLHFENRGTKGVADFDTLWVDSAFAPFGDQVFSSGFNQAASGDLDRDEDIDVFVSSLLASALAIPLERYENRGTATSPQMRRASTNPTGEIDVGRRAAPTWISDTVRTGLLLGAEDGSITWYELNQEKGEELREVRRYPLQGLSAAMPAAGDLDGDGVAEIVVGKSDALDGTTMRLYRFVGEDLVRVEWQLDTTFNIVRSGASPALVDLDGDGDLDLFSGGRNGRFSLFRNVGTPTDPLFEVDTPPAPFDTLDLGSHASPRFADLDGDGDQDAIVGSRGEIPGTLDTIRFYLNEEGTFRENALYPRLEAGQYPVPLLRNTPALRALLVGTGPGGLLYFVDALRSSVEEGEDLRNLQLDLSRAW